MRPTCDWCANEEMWGDAAICPVCLAPINTWVSDEPEARR